jgi:hypothetical protein
MGVLDRESFSRVLDHAGLAGVAIGSNTPEHGIDDPGDVPGLRQILGELNRFEYGSMVGYAIEKQELVESKLQDASE